MKQDYYTEIQIPKDVKVSLNGRTLIVEGKKGKLQRTFDYKRINIKIENNMIILEVNQEVKKDKTMLYTYEAHIKNMLKGVSEGFVYKMKIVSNHFPISVSVSNGELIVKNLFGEKNPRKLKLYNDVKVKVEGEFVVLEGIDKERVGQQAANIEQLCNITNRDRRIFYDGIYIVEKAGKSLWGDWMAKNNQLVQVKQRLKKFKFVRPNAHKLKKLDEAWRRPKRRSSLARVQIKGKPKLVKVGYRTPKDLRNKTLDGKNIVRVVRLDDFKKLDPKKDAIIIARVSKKNKIQLLQYCIDHKFEVLNHNPEESIKKYKSEFEKSSNENKEKKNAKKSKLETNEEKSEEPKKEENVSESSDNKETKKSKKKQEWGEINGFIIAKKISCWSFEMFL